MSDETTPTPEPVTPAEGQIAPDAAANAEQEKKLREARGELSRLKVKLRETSDKDLKRALESRIKELKEQWGDQIDLSLTTATTREPSIQLPDDRSKPTDAQKREAEALIARARLEITREKTKAGEDLLMQAVKVAPGDPSVLEALGDYFMTRRKYDSARVAYERAKELYPESVSIERKFGTAVLQDFNIRTSDDQSRLAMSENIFLNPGEGGLGSTASAILTCVWPGLGHLIGGRTAAGIGLMAGWLASTVWFAINYTDFAKAIGWMTGKSTHPSFSFAPPMFIMFVVFLVALKTMGSKTASFRSKKDVHRPTPPVDLPFE